MSENEKVVEHHWHGPTTNLLRKALYQYLTDTGLSEVKVREIAEAKVQEILAKLITEWLNTPKFEKIIIDEVAKYMISEQKAYEANKYGFRNRLNYLITEKLKEVLIDRYNVAITPKESK